MGITPREQETTTSIDKRITNGSTETSIKVTTDDSVGMKRKGGEHGIKDIGRQGRREVKAQNPKRTDLKRESVGVGRRKLINREGTRRMDQSGNTSRTTVTSTRDKGTIQMELSPIGGETGRRTEPGFGYKEYVEGKTVLEDIGDRGRAKAISIP